jgi:hypothetical protein
MNLKFVLLCKLGNLVALCESEVVARWLCRFELHCVLRGDGVELLLDDLGFHRLISYRQSRTDKVPPPRTESLEQAGFLTSIALSVTYLSTQKQVDARWSGNDRASQGQRCDDA